MLLLAYWTLRAGEPNFGRFKWLKHHNTFRMPGYKIYDLWFYPGAKPAEATDDIVVDLIELPDESIKVIDVMEMNAWYSIRTVRLPGNKPARLYVYEHEVKETDLIKSWDWIKHRKGKSKEHPKMNFIK